MWKPSALSLLLLHLLLLSSFVSAKSKRSQWNTLPGSPPLVNQLMPPAMAPPPGPDDGNEQPKKTPRIALVNSPPVEPKFHLHYFPKVKKGDKHQGEIFPIIVAVFGAIVCLMYLFWAIRRLIKGLFPPGGSQVHDGSEDIMD